MTEPFMKLYLKVMKAGDDHILFIDSYPNLDLPDMSEEQAYMLVKLMAPEMKENRLAMPMTMLSELIQRLMSIEEQANRDNVTTTYEKDGKKPWSVDDVNTWGNIA